MIGRAFFELDLARHVRAMSKAYGVGAVRLHLLTGHSVSIATTRDVQDGYLVVAAHSEGLQPGTPGKTREGAGPFDDLDHVVVPYEQIVRVEITGHVSKREAAGFRAK